MAINGKALAQGQLPSSKGTLFTATAVTYVKYLAVFSTHADAQTVKIYVNTAGTSRQIPPQMVLAQNESGQFIDKDAALTLEAGDLIEGETTDATSVDYVITGGEEA